MHPVLFEVFGFQIASYGTCLVLGAAAAWFLVRALAGRGGIGYDGNVICAVEDVTYAYLMCLCGGIAGAFLLRPITRIPEIFIHWEYFRQASIGVVMGYLFGEMVFYGGLIGGAASLIMYCRKTGIPVLLPADLFAPAVALAHAFGRAGCFLGGCCYGMEVHAGHPLAVRFPPETAGGALPGVPLLATQLIEAACLLLICAILVAVYLLTNRTVSKWTTQYVTVPSAELSPKSRLRDFAQGSAAPHPCSASGDNTEQSIFLMPNGFVVCLYGILYSALRFVLEFYRGDLIRGVYGPFSISQYISILVFCASVTLLIMLCLRRHERIVK